MLANLTHSRFDTPQRERLDFLAKQASRGSQPAYEKLCEAYVRYAIAVANDFHWSGLDIEELEGAALYGLARGMRLYRPGRTERPEAFVQNHILAEVRIAIWKHKRTVRASRREHQLQYKADQAREKLRQEVKRPPRLKEIAEELDVSQERLRDVLARAPTSAPLETPRDHGGSSEEVEGSLINVLVQSAFELPDTRLTERETERVMRRLLNQLSDRKAKILKMAAGMGYGRGLKDTQIAHRLDISGARVGQLRREALKSLRDWVDSLPFSLS